MAVSGEAGREADPQRVFFSFSVYYIFFAGRGGKKRQLTTGVTCIGSQLHVVSHIVTMGNESGIDDGRLL